MDAQKLREHAEAIAGCLGWRVTGAASWRVLLRSDVPDAELLLCWAREPGRMECHAVGWPRSRHADREPFRADPVPKPICFSVAKGPERCAADIRRRLLPAYLSALERARGQRDQWDAGLRLAQAGCEALAEQAESLGLTVHLRRTVGGHSGYEEIEIVAPSGREHETRVTVHVGVYGVARVNILGEWSHLAEALGALLDELATETATA